MIYILYTIFIVACLFLILVVLLQSGKGGDVAAAFGGAGSQTAFGPRGAQTPLEKATIVAAVLFMLLAFLFSLPGVTGGKSVVKAPVEAPSPSPAVPAAVLAMKRVRERLPAFRMREELLLAVSRNQVCCQAQYTTQRTWQLED